MEEFLQREPMLVGILKVLRLPPQCTFWRFLASRHLEIARQLLEVQGRMRQRVWEAAHVRLQSVRLDTDTTVHTLFGQQMGARKGYNPQPQRRLADRAVSSGRQRSGSLRPAPMPTGNASFAISRRDGVGPIASWRCAM